MIFLKVDIRFFCVSWSSEFGNGLFGLHWDLRPFLLLYNPIPFQNDINPPEIFLIKKIIYMYMLKMSMFTNFAYLGIFKKKKKQKKTLKYTVYWGIPYISRVHFMTRCHIFANQKVRCQTHYFRKRRTKECQLSKRSLKWIKRNHFVKHM
jgi:hypothetical protein